MTSIDLSYALEAISGEVNKLYDRVAALEARLPKVGPRYSIEVKSGFSLWADGNMVKASSAEDAETIVRVLRESGARYAGYSEETFNDWE